MRVIKEEANLRPWFRWLRTSWRLFELLGVGLVTFYGIWVAILQTWLSKSLVIGWLTTTVFVTGVFVCVLMRFTFTYHERILAALRSEWTRRVGIIETLGADLAEGKKLFDADLQDSTIEQLKQWHRYTASTIWQNLGEDYKYEFYKGSNTGSEMPEERSEIQSWVHDRLVAVGRMVSQLKETPVELKTGTK